MGTRQNITHNPPTSGLHYENPEEWGFMTNLTTSRLVHNLEHGGIIIYYNCQNCDEMIQQLKGI